VCSDAAPPAYIAFGMGWVDSHCHLQLDGRDPIELMDRASDVSWMMVPGVDAASSTAALALAEQHPERLIASAGLHPHDAERWGEEAERITELAHRVSAIGETGLDYYRNLAPPDAQRDSFKAQIEIASELDMPIIVHCRDAFADVHDIIESTGVGPSTVLHCWTGGPRWSRRFVDLGVTFSFAGPVAFETGDTVRLGAAAVPPERAMIETDTPYLAPPPHRGEQNEPSWVSFVGAALAAVWSLDVDEVMRLTTQRAAAVFGAPR
jgi:TatD DNase family protein